MIRKLSVLAIVALVAAGLTAGCSKKTEKVPEAMTPVPADADIVGTLDAKAFIAFAKKTLPKFVPAEMKDQMPSIEKMAEQLLKMSGVDLNKLSQVTFVGYAGSEDKMALIVDGIDIKGLKGEKQGEHNGVALYAMPDAVHYAELKGRGLVGAPSPEMLKKVLDAYGGKGKRLADSDRAKIFGELAGVEKDLNHLRVYLLTGNLPGMDQAPMTMKGGGVFLHLDKGIAATVVTDKKGATELKSQLDMGLMGIKMAMAMPEGDGDMGMGLPVKLDAETKKAVSELVNKLETESSDTTVSVSYHGDLKPLIEKGIAMGMEQAKSEFQSGMAMPEAKPEDPKAVPAPEAPPAPVPEAPATQ
jgi:hypothetical protein